MINLKYLKVNNILLFFYSTGFLVVVAILFSSFQSQRSYFVPMGHDTLAFNLPYAEVFTILNGKDRIDTALSRSVRTILVEGTEALLSRKYVLNTVRDELTIEIFEQPEVTGYLDSLPKMGKRYRDLGIPDLVWQLFPTKGRYCLLMLYNGKYHSDFQPYHYQRQSMVQNRILIGQAKVTSNLVIFLFDRVQQRLLEMDHFSTNNDPRVNDDLDALLHKALKSIYYR